jgi:hypothetical protein
MLLILLAYALTFQRVYALLAATKCPPVHVIAARASMEAPGEGVMGSLATCVKNSISAATSEGLNYPAAVDDYLASAANGTANLMKSVTAFVQQCPEAKLVLLGYSQVKQYSLECRTRHQLNILDREHTLLVMCCVEVLVDLLVSKLHLSRQN